MPEVEFLSREEALKQVTAELAAGNIVIDVLIRKEKKCWRAVFEHFDEVEGLIRQHLLEKVSRIKQSVIDDLCVDLRNRINNNKSNYLMVNIRKFTIDIESLTANKPETT